MASTPTKIALGPETYPTLDDPRGMRAFYEAEGYLVVRDAVPGELCDATVRAFTTEVKPDTSAVFLRHKSSRYEPHVFTEAGFMKYPIMNLQDLEGEQYAGFREGGLNMLTQDRVRAAVTALLDEPGRLVHTMYFDGNQKTWPHRDGDYIDSEQSGAMIGVWIAAEDIHVDAGRFCVYPRSHLLETPPGGGLDPNSKEYRAEVKAFLAESPLVRTAPALRRGDMILWSSMTVHRSLKTHDEARSRRSVTGHFVPASHDFVWFRSEQRETRSRTINDVEIVLHGDQRNRRVLKPRE